MSVHLDERPEISQALSAEARAFFGHLNARLLSCLLVIAVAVRLAAGRWTLADLLVPAALIAVQPLTEWLIHVYILHWKPRSIFGRTIDPLIARKHREHHADPRRIEWIFIPLPVLVKALPVGTIVFLLGTPTIALGATAVASGLAILLAYEWTHYLIHSRYRPRSRVYRYIWRAHRLHHFRNENYWFGVTNPAADHLLGTFPDKNDIEASPTCRAIADAGSWPASA